MIDDDDARWTRTKAALKDNANEADDLFIFLTELEGGDAEIECTAERYEIFKFVYRLPKYNAAARKRILTETV